MPTNNQIIKLTNRLGNITTQVSVCALGYDPHPIYSGDPAGAAPLKVNPTSLREVAKLLKEASEIVAQLEGLI